MSSPVDALVRSDADDAVAEGLRRSRRDRLNEAMVAHDLDALVLSRPANVHYATGARQYWMAGTRPVGPACVVIRATGRAHLLSVSDDGVPAEIAHDDLFGPSWNPADTAAALRSIPALAAARTIGTDSSTPGLAARLRAVAPGAEIVDATPAIWAARTTKTEAELTNIAAAVAIATAGLAAMSDALRPGVTERELLGVYLERVASLGAPNPPTEGVVCATGIHGVPVLRHLATDRAVEETDLVVLDPGALVAGAEGGIGRTRPVATVRSRPQEDLAVRCRRALDAVIDRCRAGATGHDLLQVWRSSGEALPPVPLVHGVGLGMEPPLIGAGIDDEVTLTTGSVLSVTGWVAEKGVGGWLERDLVVVGDGPPTVVTATGHGHGEGGAQ